jgi:hypothetical protein
MYRPKGPRGQDYLNSLEVAVRCMVARYTTQARYIAISSVCENGFDAGESERENAKPRAADPFSRLREHGPRP